MSGFIGDFPHEPEANLSITDFRDGAHTRFAVATDPSPAVSHTDTSDRLPTAAGEAFRRGRNVAALFIAIIFILAGFRIIGLLADSVVMLIVLGGVVAVFLWVHSRLT